MHLNFGTIELADDVLIALRMKYPWGFTMPSENYKYVKGDNTLGEESELYVCQPIKADSASIYSLLVCNPGFLTTTYPVYMPAEALFMYLGRDVAGEFPEEDKVGSFFLLEQINVDSVIYSFTKYPIEEVTDGKGKLVKLYHQLLNPLAPPKSELVTQLDPAFH